MRINQRLQAFNEQRLALLAEMETLDPADLVARPLPGKWSILEIVEHLAVAERSVFQNLADLSQLRDRKRRMKHRLLHGVVLFVLRTHIPVQVPSPAMLPQGGRSLAEIRRLWDESQEWVRVYLNYLGPEGARRAVLRHPVAGPLTVEQAVRMNQIHFNTHVRQIAERQKLLNGREPLNGGGKSA